MAMQKERINSYSSIEHDERKKKERKKKIAMPSPEIQRRKRYTFQKGVSIPFHSFSPPPYTCIFLIKGYVLPSL
jgi:hypothetical protein